jgi:hypothetical protein
VPKPRKHACPYCPGAAFGASSNLKTHIDVVHFKRRDHACPAAPASPSGAGQPGDAHRCGAVVHLKLHDHACPYCPGVAFGDKSTLTKHVNHVHLKIPYPRRTKK